MIRVCVGRLYMTHIGHHFMPYYISVSEVNEINHINTVVDLAKSFSIIKPSITRLILYHKLYRLYNIIIHMLQDYNFYKMHELCFYRCKIDC